MIRYLAWRLLWMLPLLLGILLLSFLVIQLAPGGPLGLETDFNPKVSPQAIEQLRAQYHLDRPLLEQFWRWLNQVIRLDFGTSLSPDARPVWDKIAAALPLTLWMNIIGLVLVFALAVPLGVVAARYANSWLDHGLMVLVFIGFAIPSFWLGLVLMLWLGVEWGVVPITGYQTIGSEAWPWWQRLLDWAHHLALPLAVGLIGSIAGLSRYMRSSVLDVIAQDYITTARAKGLPETLVFTRHALGNALLPVVTILGLSLPGLIGGSVLIESIFSLPGMGKLFYDAVLMRDYPVIMGILTLGAILTLLGNLLADLGYALIDPRIRVGKQGH